MTAVSFPCKRKRKKSFFTLVRKSICLLLLLCLSLTLIYNFQIIPILIPLTEAQTTTEVTKILQKVICETVAQADLAFVRLQYGKEGSVVSLETNASAIALVTGKITDAAVHALCSSDRITVKIPVGNLSGGALLTGRGPSISVPLAVSPKITCEIENEFYECGINQTLHRVIAEIEVEANILLPISSRKIPIETEYCIAETVIVGKVPDAYTKINRLNDDISESELDDIYDFGASAN